MLQGWAMLPVQWPVCVLHASPGRISGQLGLVCSTVSGCLCNRSLLCMQVAGVGPSLASYFGVFHRLMATRLKEAIGASPAQLQRIANELKARLPWSMRCLTPVCLTQPGRPQHRCTPDCACWSSAQPRQ